MLHFIKNNKLFSRLVTINFISKIGDRLFYTAMLTVATSLESGSVAVMIVSISETLPILLSIFLGVIADKRRDKIKCLVWSSLFRTAMYIGIGLLFGFRPSFNLILLAAGLNFISDIFGNFSSALFSPYTKRLIRADEMEQAQGIMSLGTQLVSVMATFIGAFLLGVFKESTIAFLNAAIFFAVAIMYWRVRSFLKEPEIELTTMETDNVLHIVRENIRLLVDDNELFVNLIQLAMINGFFGGITPVFALFLNTNHEMVLLSNAVKISLLSGVITLFMIVGNALTTKIVRKMSIYRICVIPSVIIILEGIAFMMNRLVLIFIATGLIAFFLGIVSPRFSAKIVNKYPIERIGGIITSVNALLVVTPPLTSFLFPILATKNITYAYWGFIAYALLLVVICFRLKYKKAT